MYVAGKCSDKRPHKIISHGYVSFEGACRKLDDDVIGIIGENLVFIRAFPGIEEFLNKRTNILCRDLVRRSLHNRSRLHTAIAAAFGANYTPQERRVDLPCF